MENRAAERWICQNWNEHWFGSIRIRTGMVIQSIESDKMNPGTTQFEMSLHKINVVFKIYKKLMWKNK